MTRKDYVFLADTFKASFMNSADSYHPGICIAVMDMAAVLSHENARFDEDRFLKAAGVRPTHDAERVHNLVQGGV